MLRVIFRLIVVAEAAVGVTMTGLLLLGRTEPNIVANTLSVIGVLFLILGSSLSTLSPIWRRLGGPTFVPGKDEGSFLKGTRIKSEGGLAERAGYLIRGAIPAAILIGTGLLFYFFPIEG